MLMLGKSKLFRNTKWLDNAPENGNWYSINRNRDRLRAAVEEYAHMHGAPEGIATVMADMLERQALSACAPSMKYGTALIHVLNDYFAWGRKRNTDVTTLYVYLEMHGFQYPHHTQTLALMSGLWAASKSPREKAKPSKADNLNRRREFMALASVFAAAAGWGSETQDVCAPLCSPKLPKLAVDVVRKLKPDMGEYSNCVVNTTAPPEGTESNVSTLEVWLVMRAMEEAGASQVLINAFFDADENHVFVGLALLKNDLIHKKVVVGLTNNPGYADDRPDWIAQLGLWIKHGCAGGFPTWKYIPPEPIVPTPDRSGILSEPKAPSQRPTGNKRHHHNYKGDDEEVEIDWETAASLLESADLLPGLDEDLVRAVLVHGLMHQGDRAVDPRGNKLKKAKLWRAGRRGLEDTPKREFESMVGKLVSAKVLEFKRGYYRLATKNPYNHAANEMIGRTRALYSSLAS